MNATALSNRLVPLRFPDTRWRNWLSGAIALGLLAAIAVQLDHTGLARLRGAFPTAPGFWLALGAYYLALPSSEWLIYRRLWRLPGAGFAALLRKLVSNEILVGYSGELSFYSWARARSGLTTAPFAAIKDVSIMSAVAGNLATLVMTLAALPYLGSLGLAIPPRTLGLSLGAVLATSLVVGLLRARIFSLSRRNLRFVLGIHLLRVAATTMLAALAWHCALPAVPFSTWTLLAALQLLVTRLPFVPNKDLLFAGATIWLIGSTSAIATLIALIASLILAAHLLIGAVLAIFDLATLAEGR